MGVDYNIYVGPYIVVHNPLKASTEEYHSCPTENCNNHKIPISDGFCSKCGSKIQRMLRSCQNRIDFDYWNGFGGRLAEAFFEYKPDGCEDYQYLIPNMGNDVGIHIDAKSGESENVIDMETLANDNKRFFDRMKKELRKLSSVFGKNNVTVKWGVLCWQS